MKDIPNTHNNIRTALAAEGILNPEQRFSDAFEELARFIGILHKRFANQFAYDLLTNLPAGTVTPETLQQHSFHVAIVATIGEYLEWDAEAVTMFVGKVLEDSNIHGLAEVVFSKTKQRDDETYGA